MTNWAVLRAVGVWGALGVLLVALATARATGEVGVGLLTASALTAVAVLLLGWAGSVAPSVAVSVAGPAAAMVFLLALGWLAPDAAALTVSLWPAVFAYVGVSVSAGVAAGLYPVAAAGIWAAMHLPLGQQVPRWLIVMGLVVVVTQLPARLLAAMREQQHQLIAEHRDAEEAHRALELTQQRFTHAFAASPVGMSLSDEHGHFVEVNSALCRLTGRAATDLLGRSADHITHPEDRHVHTQVESMMDRSVDGTTVLTQRYIRPDGTERTVEITLAPVAGPQQQRWTLAHIHDVTDRRLAEQQMARAHQVNAVLADVTRSVVQRRTEVRDAVTHGAQQLTNATGVALVEAMDDRTLTVTGATDPATLGARIDLAQLTMTGAVWASGRAIDVVDVAAEATVNPALAQVHQMVSGYWQPVTGPGGEVLAVIAASWDHQRDTTSTEVQLAMEVLAAEAGAALYADGTRRRLETTATQDPLTGLANRRGWDERLSSMTAAQSLDGTTVAIAMIDLDQFKTYNDTFGHQDGDQLLQAFANLLRACVRDTDLASRWGGDEFALALTVRTETDARTVLDRIVNAVPHGRTCSIGLSLYKPGEPAAHALARADQALYAAKRAGRNRVVTGYR